LNINTASIIGLGLTVLIKLGLAIVCYMIDNAAARALAQDHRNDVLSNTVAAATVFGGKYWRAELDPIGGIIISVYIMFTWAKTALEQGNLLTGKSADHDLIRKLTYIAYKHDSRVVAVETVCAYTSGSGYFVELHIILPESMSLRMAHDIGEALEIKLEKLAEVERAFVHIDVNDEHIPEHTHHEARAKFSKAGFFDRVFVISGKFARPKSAIKILIERRGGRVKERVDDSVDYLLASKSSLRTKKVLDAKARNIPIIDESFIDQYYSTLLPTDEFESTSEEESVDDFRWRERK